MTKPKPTSIRLMLSAAVVALALPASAQLWTGSSDPDDLRYRLDVLDAELADIRARLGGGGGASTRPGGGGTVGGSAGQQLNALEAEIRALTARVEQLEFAQRRIADDAAKRFGDIEFRLTELEGGDISAIGDPVPLGGGALAGATTGGRTPSAVAETSVSERADLDRAIDDVKQGRFDQAEERLNTFIRTYPGSPLIGDAQYWLAESHFVRGNYAAAAQNFLRGYQSDVGGTRAPDNLLKLGVSLGKLGEVSDACLTLREVRNQYPQADSSVLRQADAEARSLSCG